MTEQCEIPLADTPCGACGCEPAWLWPNGDVLCASCYHQGEKPNQVKTEIRANIKKARVARDTSTILRSHGKRSRQHPEADFQNQVVIPFLRLKHYKVFHAGQGMIPDHKGGWRWSTPASKSFPDIIAVPEKPESVPSHWPLLIAWECKAEGGVATEGQMAWIRSFDAVPRSSARVVRPDDWNEIAKELQ